MIYAKQLAHYIVDKCTKDNHPVSNLQLQKIMYFLQSVFCRATRGSLLFQEEFEAWPYGPVLSDIYEEYSEFGGRVIEHEYDSCETSLDVSSEVGAFLDDGIKALRRKYPWDLVRLSHTEGSPWAKVYNGGAGYKHRFPHMTRTPSSGHGHPVGPGGSTPAGKRPRLGAAA